jgi:hypothetical protein
MQSSTIDDNKEFVIQAFDGQKWKTIIRTSNDGEAASKFKSFSDIGSGTSIRLMVGKDVDGKKKWVLIAERPLSIIEVEPEPEPSVSFTSRNDLPAIVSRSEVSVRGQPRAKPSASELASRLSDAREAASEARKHGENNILAYKSRVAYIRCAVYGIIGAMFTFGIFHGIWCPIMVSLDIFITILALLGLRSIVIGCDAIGVYAIAGVFPWQRRRCVVKWSDVDKAVFHQSFLSWLAKSFTVEVMHKYTKCTEILLTEMENGDKAVGEINNVHVGFLETGFLSR